MPAPAKRDLFPGVLELMVLRSLELEPLHGYALATRIQQRDRKSTRLNSSHRR